MDRATLTAQSPGSLSNGAVLVSGADKCAYGVGHQHRPGGEAMTTIFFNQVTLGSLARIAVICSACLWLPFGGLVGLAALFGVSPFTFEINDVQVTGGPGLLGGIMLGVLFALLGTLSMIAGACLSRLVPRALRGQKLRIMKM
jgi:hypothetical protein